MKLKSLVREDNTLVPVEVEISLLPGLPTIQFLGLPDQIIKESIHRIKSAIRSQNFDFPRAQQVFVNIRPNHLKKSSRGLELAVAAGILWETGQVPMPLGQNNFFIYGELGLNGQVFEPDDLASDFEADENSQVLTGTLSSVCCPFPRRVVHELKNLTRPQFHPVEMREVKINRPKDGLSLSFPESHAEILAAVALGGHSLLLAGPSGSGKTTLVKALSSFLAEPLPEEILEMKKMNKDLTHENSMWRPIIHPHHSSSPLAMVGGGVPLKPGEISRAHRGLLILDELLEFHPKVQEALREPMEEGSLRLSRSNRAIRYPAMAQVVATTNLCPCGDFTPGCRVRCRFSLLKCRSYSHRLSGPMVDRFEVLHFTERARARELGKVTGEQILQKVEVARAWVSSTGRATTLNSRRLLPSMIADIGSAYYDDMLNRDMGSHRRHQATVRVARTLADLDCNEKIEDRHMEKALLWTWKPFEKMKLWD